MTGMSHMGTRRVGESGFSVTELLVVMVLLSVVLSAVYMVMGTASRVYDQSAATMQVNEQSRTALERMGLDFRQAQEVTPGVSGAFITASPREAVFWCQADKDNSAEKVRYYVVGNDLLRTIFQTSDTVATASSVWTSGTTSTLLTDLSPSFTGPIFTYLNQQGSTPATFSSAAQQFTYDPDQFIQAVQVDWVVLVRSGSVTKSAETSATIRLRSVGGVN